MANEETEFDLSELRPRSRPPPPAARHVCWFICFSSLSSSCSLYVLATTEVSTSGFRPFRYVPRCPVWSVLFADPSIHPSMHVSKNARPFARDEQSKARYKSQRSACCPHDKKKPSRFQPPCRLLFSPETGKSRTLQAVRALNELRNEAPSAGSGTLHPRVRFLSVDERRRAGANVLCERVAPVVCACAAECASVRARLIARRRDGCEKFQNRAARADHASER
mmetsp:Transcript_3682/g.6454  ORF Transcript_3682/g.6454 Transcript_3682/m.6454 type:complete len:223 (+) Transcript_3682:337-1005(+)